MLENQKLVKEPRLELSSGDNWKIVAGLQPFILNFAGFITLG